MDHVVKDGRILEGIRMNDVISAPIDVWIVMIWIGDPDVVYRLSDFHAGVPVRMHKFNAVSETFRS